jgi:uncharacterized protein YkwD
MSSLWQSLWQLCIQLGGSLLDWLLSALGGAPSPAPAPPPASPSAPPPLPAPPPPEPAPDATSYRLLELHNRARAQVGARPLSLDRKLHLAAQKHADWMSLNRSLEHWQETGTPGFFGRNLAERVHLAGYRLRTGGENIALGQRGPEQVVAAWLSSPGHRQNIQDTAYQHAGFGLSYDSSGRPYWCAVLAAPAPPWQSSLSLPPAVTE